MKKTMNKRISNKLILVLCIFVMSILCFTSCEHILKKTESNRVYQKQPIEKVHEEPKLKTCYECKGEGIIICNMCGGRGTNNLGMTCGCITHVESMRRLGKTASRTALRWKCEVCKGTGSLKKRY